MLKLMTMLCFSNLFYWYRWFENLLNINGVEEESNQQRKLALRRGDTFLFRHDKLEVTAGCGSEEVLKVFGVRGWDLEEGSES